MTTLTTITLHRIVLILALVSVLAFAGGLTAGVDTTSAPVGFLWQQSGALPTQVPTPAPTSAPIPRQTTVLSPLTSPVVTPTPTASPKDPDPRPLPGPHTHLTH